MASGTFLTSVITEDSDFLTIHNAFASWRRAYANGQSAARTLCKKSFLSYQVYISNINSVPIVSLCPTELAAYRRDTPTIPELPSRRIIRPCGCHVPERALSVCPSLLSYTDAHPPPARASALANASDLSPYPPTSTQMRKTAHLGRSTRHSRRASSPNSSLLRKARCRR